MHENWAYTALWSKLPSCGDWLSYYSFYCNQVVLVIIFIPTQDNSPCLWFRLQPSVVCWYLWNAPSIVFLSLSDCTCRVLNKYYVGELVDNEMPVFRKERWVYITCTAFFLHSKLLYFMYYAACAVNSTLLSRKESKSIWWKINWLVVTEQFIKPPIASKCHQLLSCVIGSKNRLLGILQTPFPLCVCVC